MPSTTEKFALIVALEGEAKPRSIEVPRSAQAGAILEAIKAETGRSDIAHLLREDTDEPIIATDALAESLASNFSLIHAASPGKIEVKFLYDNQSTSNSFGPSATMRALVTWAISDEGFALIGEPAEFQVKADGKIVPPDQHLGQLTKGDKAITLTLVHNIKPQG